MENLIQSVEEMMLKHDCSYGQKRLNSSAGYILACLKAGNIEDAKTELINNGDKISKQTKNLLKANNISDGFNNIFKLNYV